MVANVIRHSKKAMRNGQMNCSGQFTSADACCRRTAVSQASTFFTTFPYTSVSR